MCIRDSDNRDEGNVYVWRFLVPVQMCSHDILPTEQVGKVFHICLLYTSHLRAAAIVRSMTYDNLVANKAESETGWGVLLSTTFNLCSKVQVYGLSLIHI